MIEIGVLPLVIFYFANNLVNREYLYAYQNLGTALIIGTSLFFLLRGRYAAAVGMLFCGLMPLVQIVFILAEFWASSYSAIAPYDLASLHCAIGIILAGSFSQDIRTLLGSIAALVVIFLAHTILLVDVLVSPVFAHLGVLIYQLIAVVFGIFIYLSQRELKQILEERLLLYTRLEEAAAEKELLFANMSHEIRNPLNTVVGSLARLGHTELDGEQSEIVNGLDRGCSELNALLSNLLVQSRGTQTVTEPIRLSCDPYELIKAIITRFERIAEYVGRLTLHRDGLEVSRISTDPAALDQILTNVIDNSLKFSPRETPVKITISARRTHEKEAAISIEVADRGPGIDDEHRERIFEPYYQIDRGATKIFGGAGLGLSAVRELTPLIDGEISLIETGLRGTTFLLRFSAERLETTPGARTNPEVESGRICVAEDNSINRLNLKVILTAEGYKVSEAIDGYQALACVEANRPEVLLLDMQMPRMDGFECARRLRDHPDEAIRGLPILAITGYSFAADRSRMLASGVDDIILKPYDERDLISKIEELRRQAGRGSETV